MLGVKQAEALTALLGDDRRPLSDILSDFSAQFLHESLFKSSAALLVLLEDKVLEANKRLIAYALLLQAYSSQHVSSNPHILFLIDAACNETTERFERQYIMLLLGAFTPNNNNEVLKQSIADYIKGFEASNHVANAAGVPVILDAGGMGGSIPKDLLKFIDILSPNETELSQLSGMPTDTCEQIDKAARACHRMGVKEVLVKLGSRGSALFTEGEEPIWQPIFAVPKVVDTTGAGDTFTAAFAVALVEGSPRRECLQFAAAAASLCVQVMGATPSMPDRTAVMNVLHSISV